MWPTKKAVDTGTVGRRYNSIPKNHPTNPNNLSKHLGQDLPAPAGSNIHALADGVVTKVRYQMDKEKKQGWGYYIEIQHSNGYITRYAHLTEGSMKFEKGQTVKNGDVIALSGQSGGVTGPHLHVEILLSGKAKDPLEIEDLQILLNELNGKNEKAVNHNNPIELGEVNVTGKRPEQPKSIDALEILNKHLGNNRPNAHGNTGQYNRQGRTSDQFYSDDFLKWYYKK